MKEIKKITINYKNGNEITIKAFDTSIEMIDGCKTIVWTPAEMAHPIFNTKFLKINENMVDVKIA